MALLAFPLYSPANSQAPVIERGFQKPVSIQLDAIPKGALVTLMLRDIFRVPYLIQSEVLQDRSPVSVKLSFPQEETPYRVVSFLRSIGLVVELVGGTVYVSKAGVGSGRFPQQSLPGQVFGPQDRGGSFGGAPAAPALPAFEPVSIAIVRPVHRSPVEIAETLRGALPSVTATARASQSPDSSEQLINGASDPDQLVLSAAPDLVEAALQLVAALDVPRPMVSLKILVLEVRTDYRKGSAIQVLSDALGGSLRLSSYPGLPPGPQAVSLTVGGITAIASAVREDGRFRVLANPQVLVESGARATLNAGADVPTLGAVTFSDGGQATRSVQYRQSGVILNVAPSVIGGRIALKLQQERSSFSPTSNGVDDSPTLDKTNLSTALSFTDGETITLGGLSEASDGDTKRGIFGGLLRSNQYTETSRELLIVIEASIIEVPQTEQLKPTVLGPFDIPAQSTSLIRDGGTN